MGCRSFGESPPPWHRRSGLTGGAAALRPALRRPNAWGRAERAAGALATLLARLVWRGSPIGRGVPSYVCMVDPLTAAPALHRRDSIAQPVLIRMQQLVRLQLGHRLREERAHGRQRRGRVRVEVLADSDQPCARRRCRRCCGLERAGEREENATGTAPRMSDGLATAAGFESARRTRRKSRRPARDAALQLMDHGRPLPGPSLSKIQWLTAMQNGPRS